MIASLYGKLETLFNDSAVLTVGGIGFRIYMPTSALGLLGSPGVEVKLYTHLHVREDNLSLYGFVTQEELGLFETLITVSGIGPKLALAMLSAMNVEQLTLAIASGNTSLLQQVPGIGKKTSERLVLELKDKIEAGLVSAPLASSAQGQNDVVAALLSLGYSVSEATHAAASLPSSDANLEDKIRLALQYFGGR